MTVISRAREKWVGRNITHPEPAITLERMDQHQAAAVSRVSDTTMRDKHRVPDSLGVLDPAARAVYQLQHQNSLTFKLQLQLAQHPLAPMPAAYTTSSRRQVMFDRIRAYFKTDEEPTGPEYAPVAEEEDDEIAQRQAIVDEDEEDSGSEVLVGIGARDFSWYEYVVFLVLGVAMLWAWNMFLAAAPYFQSRFANDPAILAAFQSAITSVSSVTNLLVMLVLGYLQANASYTNRILLSLLLNFIVFALLAISTKTFVDVSSAGYLTFTLVMVFTTSIATGLCQNGTFAFAASFGHSRYIQAIMTGQALAGVLPSIAGIISVLVIPEDDDSADSTVQAQQNATATSNSALVYFITACAIGLATLVITSPLIRKHNRREKSLLATAVEGTPVVKRKSVGMITLYKKLYWLTASVFLCFLVAMFFPVFTQKIVSVVPPDEQSRLFKPQAFIPLGFLVWNVGDLTGRLLTLVPMKHRIAPPVLLLIAFLRIGHIPLYLLCNIDGHGAKVNSDFFYMAIQICFGITNGWLGSTCMMMAGDYVNEDERAAQGGFMAVNLMAGLTIGSLLSFSAAHVH